MIHISRHGCCIFSETFLSKLGTPFVIFLHVIKDNVLFKMVLKGLAALEYLISYFDGIYNNSKLHYITVSTHSLSLIVLNITLDF